MTPTRICDGSSEMLSRGELTRIQDPTLLSGVGDTANRPSFREGWEPSPRSKVPDISQGPTLQVLFLMIVSGLFTFTPFYLKGKESEWENKGDKGEKLYDMRRECLRLRS